jgi:hypothetical protein
MKNSRQNRQNRKSGSRAGDERDERVLAKNEVYIDRTDDTAAHARAGVARRLAQLVAAEAEVVLVLKRKNNKKKSSAE